MKPNNDKCTMLFGLIGSLKDTNFELCCNLLLKWSSGPIDVLPISRNMEHITKENRNLHTVYRNLKVWRITLYGKMINKNSLVISQFI